MPRGGGGAGGPACGLEPRDRGGSLSRATTTPAAALAALAALAAGACSPGAEPADLVLTGGRVVTVDAALPEAEALAVRNGRIVAVGSAAEIGARVGADTRVIDLEGRLAVPGFIEAHGHYLSLGRSKTILDLTEATSFQEIVDLVAGAVAEVAPGTWIEGTGWHQERWSALPPGAVDGVATHHALSDVSPENPVVLGHASGHAAFANALAMELAGIGPGTPDPPGGTIVRDAGGAATGMLRENADALVYGALAASREDTGEEQLWEEFVRNARLAGEEALANGVTTFHDAGPGFATIDRFKRLADEGGLPVRLYLMVRGESNASMRERLAEYRMIGYADDFLTVRAIKRQIDGALGSHGAWLLEPYADMPGSTGLTVEDPADIEETARIAAELGFQLATHAIGDRANRVVLDIYGRTFAAYGAGDRRWRIEHAQHLHPSDVPRFAELGVIASMQGVHATSDAPWVPLRLGAERAESGAYLWRSLLDEGVVVANGTDTPVERISPIASLASSIVREDRQGNPFFPGQRMSRMEALESYTIDNAYAAFEEGLKGSLTVGKLADVVVLDRDILTVPEEEIARARVDLTILGGEVRYERPR